jgi:hypothetical protein
MNSLFRCGSACRKSVADLRRHVTATATGFSGIEGMGPEPGIRPGGTGKVRISPQADESGPDRRCDLPREGRPYEGTPHHDASRWSGCGGPAPHLLHRHRLHRAAVHGVNPHAVLATVPDSDAPGGHPHAGTRADVVNHLRAHPVTGARADVVNHLRTHPINGGRGTVFAHRDGAGTDSVISSRGGPVADAAGTNSHRVIGTRADHIADRDGTDNCPSTDGVCVGPAHLGRIGRRAHLVVVAAGGAGGRTCRGHSTAGEIQPSAGVEG